jgi:hypothetical protein
MKARQVIDGAAFGPEALKVIGQAFDAAWKEVADNFGDDPQDIEAARLRLANAVLSVAHEDTRVVDVLKRAALQRMALDFRVGEVGGLIGVPARWSQQLTPCRSFSKREPKRPHPRCDESQRTNDKGDTQRDVRPARLALDAARHGDQASDDQADNEPSAENVPPTLLHDAVHSLTEATWHERGGAIPVGEQSRKRMND